MSRKKKITDDFDECISSNIAHTDTGEDEDEWDDAKIKRVKELMKKKKKKKKPKPKD